MRKKREDATHLQNTPPPSPPAERPSIETDGDENVASKTTIDMEGVNDEIVEAVIVQLQESGNRPHLVKELAAVLIQRLKIVQQSVSLPDPALTSS